MSYFASNFQRSGLKEEEEYDDDDDDIDDEEEETSEDVKEEIKQVNGCMRGTRCSSTSRL